MFDASPRPSFHGLSTTGPSLRRAATVSLPLLLVPLLTACASTPGGEVERTESSTTVRGVVIGGAGDPEIELTNESTAYQRLLDAPLAAVWDAVVETYGEMQIPVTEDPEPPSRLRTIDLRLTRIGDDRIARFVDCGSGITGQRASSWDVTVSFVTSLEPAGEEGVRVVTDLDARARPRGTSGGPVHCTSRGELERRLFEGVTRRLSALP